MLHRQLLESKTLSALKLTLVRSDAPPRPTLEHFMDSQWLARLLPSVHLPWLSEKEGVVVSRDVMEPCKSKSKIKKLHKLTRSII